MPPLRWSARPPQPPWARLWAVLRPRQGRPVEGAAAPALAAIQKATQQATAAAGELRGTVGWVSWKWAGIMAASSAGALGAFFLAAWLIVPSAGELRALQIERDMLQANVAALEKRGARVKFGTCGDKKRTCVLIDQKAGSFGTDGEVYMIPKGY